MCTCGKFSIWRRAGQELSTEGQRSCSEADKSRERIESRFFTNGYQAVIISSVSLKECEECFFASYGVPGLYTIDESVFLMDEKGIWLAFVSSCQKWEGKVAVYTQKDKKYILPQGIKEWVERQKKFHTEGVVFKNFR